MYQVLQLKRTLELFSQGRQNSPASMDKNKIIFILGPTASGKTAVSIELAKRIGGEIISCDSMQIYRQMDTLTQAPLSSDLLQVTYHLVKKLSPEEEFNAAQFVNEASGLIESILSNNKEVIISGGTGLYMKSFLDGLFPSPPKDEDLRKELTLAAEKNGNEYLYNKLKEVDPKTAEKLHVNDLRRIIRALEVYELAGKTIDEKKQESEGIHAKYDCKLFGLKLDREVLYERIDHRVERMMDDGLINEVKKLRDLNLSMTAGKAIGIREISDYLDGKITIDKALEELKKNTRRYAKRQLTWFNADKRIVWVNADRDITKIVDDIVTKIV